MTTGRRATENFRRQHAELGALAHRVALLARGDAVANRALELRALLTQLAGRLRVHAAMEDEALYPRLQAHPDPGVRAMAADFRRRFGDVYEAFLDYHRAWPAEAIRARPAQFADLTLALLASLTERVHAENSELYEAVDRLF